jgi:uncharacterized protein (TIGR02145 family)
MKFYTNTMPGVTKRNTITRIILAVTIVTGFLLCFVLSCEIFDYERVIIIETGSSPDKSCNSAVLTGQLIDLGESKIIQHGHCWSEDPEPQKDLDPTNNLGSRESRGSFTSLLQGLLPDTKYYFRAFATDAKGTTAYGEEKSFTTDPGNLPVPIFFVSATAISAGQCVQFFDQSANAPASRLWHFGDGSTSSLKDPFHCYTTTGIYPVELTVSNNCGTNTLTKDGYIWVQETFVDGRDGHEYRWVRIGEQIWMAENLAYLPEVSPPTDYSPVNGLKYVYNHTNNSIDEAKASFNYSTYGVLYNWTAAMHDATGSVVDPSGVQGICPDGWHLPSNDEWFELIYYVGGNWEDPFNTNAGGHLKEVEYSHWSNPNTGAANTYGFTGLPGGAYFSNDGGSFDYLGSEAFWWSSDVDTIGSSWGLSTENEFIHWYYSDKSYGNSVRCIKDGGNLKKQLPGKVDYKPVMVKPGK